MPILGTLKVDPPFVLSPMAGVTDRYFRRIIRDLGGVGLVTMEFISSESLTRGIERTLNMIAFGEEERPLSIQIYGKDPARMADAAQIVEEIGADAVDINMGCPANKVLKGCAGAALMGDLDLARSIIRAVRGRVRLPLTVKFRVGLDDGCKNFLELGRICQDEGANGVSLHARTARQMYTGQADWTLIGQLKRSLDIPVFGNGDIREPSDALRMMEATGCDAVLIGRAAVSNPWIFRQTEALRRGQEVIEAGVAERRDLILGHFRLLAAAEEEGDALHKIRTFAGRYTHGLANGKRLRQKIQSIRTVGEFLDEVERFFEEALAGWPAPGAPLSAAAPRSLPSPAVLE
jgi:nifR3 family TIM-barrel protein